MIEPRPFLRTLFDAAVAAAVPENCLPSWLPTKPGGRVIVVGAGKAAASMAKELEKQWGGPLEGRSYRSLWPRHKLPLGSDNRSVTSGTGPGRSFGRRRVTS